MAEDSHRNDYQIVAIPKVQGVARASLKIWDAME